MDYNLQRKRWNDEWEIRMRDFSEFKQLIRAATMMKTFSSNAGAKAFVAHLKTTRKMDANDFVKFLRNPDDFIEKTDDGKKKWKDMVGHYEMAKRTMEKSLAVTSDVLFGTVDQNPVAMKFLLGSRGVPNLQTKSASELINHMEMARVISMNMSWTAPKNLDMNWMLAFQPVDMRGASWGKIIDFFGAAKFHEITGNERIKYSTLGKDNAIEIYKRVFGGGHLIDVDWIENNGAMTLNDAFASLRVAAQVKQGDLGYGLLTTEFNATTLFNATETEDIPRVIDTLNDAGDAIKQDFMESNEGIAISEDEVILLYCHPNHRHRIEAALEARRGVGKDVSKVVSHNFQPIWSRKVPVTSGSKNAVFCVIGGHKIMMAYFKDMATNEEHDFDAQKLKAGAVEKYSPVVKNKKQIRRINLEV